MKPSRVTTIGFTLIELMVSIAIVAIMLVVAAPSFRNFIRNSELTSLTNKLLAAINAARSEAMKYGQNAMVVPANGGNDWTQGWIVFVDSNRNNSYDETTDVTIQKQGALPSYFSVTGTGNANLSNSYIMFESSGFAKSYGAAPGVPNLTLKIERTDVSSANEKRFIIVARTGRVRACNPSLETTCTATATQ
ncbi:MAG: GspH/FimT family pseudopilin [Burkholderiaceae bacterium]